jgi:hypothetical protein
MKAVNQTLEQRIRQADVNNFCMIWSEAKPLVIRASKAWFLPKKIKSVLSAIIFFLDKLCQ